MHESTHTCTQPNTLSFQRNTDLWLLNSGISVWTRKTLLFGVLTEASLDPYVAHLTIPVDLDARRTG